MKLTVLEAIRAWRLYRRYEPMLSTLLKGGQWANLTILVAQLLNDALNVFPTLANNHWFVIAQGILAVILPSVSKTISDSAHNAAKP